MNNIKEMDRKTTKMERKVKKIGRKIRFYGIIGAILLGIGLAFYLFMKVSQFYDENRILFQSPIIIKLQAPVRIEKRAKEVKKQASMPSKIVLNSEKATTLPKTEFEIVNNSKYGQIMWRVYQLETQRGLTDGCRLKGEGFGGFGVKSDSKTVVCYETFSKAVERANYWFGLLKPENSLVDALCSWNLGTAPPPKGSRPVGGFVNCNYYLDYISL